MEDFSNMNIEELFQHVEKILYGKGLNNAALTWVEIAGNIKEQEPELAEMLIAAQKHWDAIY